MISELEDFFTKGCGRCARFATPDCATQIWSEGLTALRTLCRETGMEEVLRWAYPCYRHAGRNVAVIVAVRGDFRLNFIEAGLLQSPLLERQGPNTTHPDTIRFTAADQVAVRAEGIRDCLAQAMAHASAGRRAPRAEGEPDVPEELLAALDDDPELTEAFAALTPGRRRSHIIQIASAKAPATRQARVEKARPKIMAGLGALER